MCTARHKSMELRKENFFSRVQFAICVIKSSNLIIFYIIDIPSYETKNAINIFCRYLLHKEIFNQKVHFYKNALCKGFPSKLTFSPKLTPYSTVGFEENVSFNGKPLQRTFFKK